MELNRIYQGGVNVGFGAKTASVSKPVKTLGWQPTCSCGIAETVPCIVLDPFMGSGTVAEVALRANRRFIGIELNPEYIALAEKRIEPLMKQRKLL